MMWWVHGSEDSLAPFNMKDLSIKFTKEMFYDATLFRCPHINIHCWSSGRNTSRIVDVLTSVFKNLGFSEGAQLKGPKSGSWTWDPTSPNQSPLPSVLPPEIVEIEKEFLEKITWGLDHSHGDDQNCNCKANQDLQNPNQSKSIQTFKVNGFACRSITQLQLRTQHKTTGTWPDLTKRSENKRITWCYSGDM